MAVALGEAAITAECGAASVVCKVSVTENGGLTNTVSDTMSIVSDGGTIRISGVPSNERVRVLRVDGTMVYERHRQSDIRSCSRLLHSGCRYRQIQIGC